MHINPGAVFTKGLSQVFGLSWLYFYTKVKPKTWLKPFVNTAPGEVFIYFIYYNDLHTMYIHKQKNYIECYTQVKLELCHFKSKKFSIQNHI